MNQVISGLPFQGQDLSVLESRMYPVWEINCITSISLKFPILMTDQVSTKPNSTVTLIPTSMISWAEEILEGDPEGMIIMKEATQEASIGVTEILDMRTREVTEGTTDDFISINYSTNIKYFI